MRPFIVIASEAWQSSAKTGIVALMPQETRNIYMRNGDLCFMPGKWIAISIAITS
jgi:hypothetical protein